MKIERTSAPEKVFKDMGEGEIFCFDENIYIKIEPVCDHDDYIGDTEIYNCVNLESGICGYLDDEEKVEPLPDAVLKIF